MIAELELLDEQIFTLLAEYVQEHLPELEDEHFGMVQCDPSDEAKLPYIFIDKINAVETAVDLESNKVNGGLFTYQVRVTSNNSKEEVKKIMQQVTNAMKTMAFRGTSLPVFIDTDNLHIQIARWQREINEGDTLSTRPID